MNILQSGLVHACSGPVSLTIPVVEKKITLNQGDRKKGSLVDQIKSAAERHGVELTDGWKPEVARRIFWTEPKRCSQS